MAYDNYEVSISDSQPVELYKFTYNNQIYSYTSSQYSYQIGGIVYNPEYIKRGDTLKLGDSGGTVETCIIIVPRTNNIALLYQGAPPELSSVKIEVFRIHGQATTDMIKIIDGVVSQVRFNGSDAELTITIENVLNRDIPRGTLSYNCQNCIYDEKCNLKAEDYKFRCTVTGWSGLTLQSLELRDKPSGYFTDGYMQMGNSIRAITIHYDNTIQIKYPINSSDRLGVFYAYPGCSQVFKTCATRFNNTDNFNGIPYIPPYNAYKHNAYEGRLPYWIDGNMHYFDSKGYHGVMGLG